MQGLNDRERLNLSLADAEQLDDLSVKNDKVYDFFSKNLNVNRSKQHDSTFQYIKDKTTTLHSSVLG